MAIMFLKVIWQKVSAISNPLFAKTDYNRIEKQKQIRKRLVNVLSEVNFAFNGTYCCQCANTRYLLPRVFCLELQRPGPGDVRGVF